MTNPDVTVYLAPLRPIELLAVYTRVLKKSLKSVSRSSQK